MSEQAIAEQKTGELSVRISEVSLSKDIWPDPKDLLGRCGEIENLTPLVENAKAPFVLSIDAPWGGGKTTFIKLWQNYFNTRECPKVSLYLNAWENDFAEDPLLALLACLDKWLGKEDPDSKTGKAWKVAKEYLPGVARGTITAAVKAATFGALDADKAIEKVASDLAGAGADKLINDFNARKSDLEKFKAKLAEAIEALPGSQRNLIVFIDELDRCRPNFAIELLERIKHLFDLERIVFVIAVNHDQLGRGIKGVYGNEFDGHSYLERFFDVEYQLSASNNYTYAKMLLMDREFETYFSSRREGREELLFIQKAIPRFCARFSYEPRDINRFIVRLKLILSGVSSENYLDIWLVVVLLFVRRENEKLYNNYMADAGCANQIAEFLLEGFTESILEHEVPYWLSFTLGFLISLVEDYEKKDSLIQYWKENPNMITFSIADAAYDLSSNLIGTAERSHYEREPAGIRKLAFDRIELLHAVKIISAP
ncbi:P-loop NTPase fold protein [Microbulbifer sp. VAAF005]|uniref:KAP family P-loop NTPase fold protein n=1 Tax=Microbulbifer sp. VAAF005 TaxID=3034230 RepID=UPI0024AE2932|nr:P-loop NTPase fold protein [Microbulbifer sp. VAAF005]WHI45682.1 P-loop NTPase fold protein [Microbulbifer sp. VAAF005]